MLDIIELMFKRDYPVGPQKIEALLAQSAIDASLFLPFTLFRLRPYAINQQMTLEVSLYAVNIETPQIHNLQLAWDSTSDTLITPPIQQSTLTEWAACGIALALVPVYTPYRVLEVAQMSERFDYWLGNSLRDVGLEKWYNRWRSEYAHEAKTAAIEAQPL